MRLTGWLQSKKLLALNAAVGVIAYPPSWCGDWTLSLHHFCTS